MADGVGNGCVMVVSSVVAPALLACCATVLLARRWPRLDPTAPRLDEDSPLVRKEVTERPRLRLLLRRDIDPAVATSVTLAVGVTALLVLAAGIGVLLIMVQTNTGLAKWDLAIARWGADHASAGSTTALRHVSLLGGTAGVLAIALVAGTIEYIRRPNRAIPSLLVLTVLGQFAISNIVKTVVSRDRPDISQLTGFSGASFPSGHATAAAATFAVVALLVGRGRSRGTRNALAGLAIGLAVLVAASRVMLGIHWLTDVVAGLALGWAWLAACSIAFGGRLLQFGAPVAAAVEVARHPSEDALSDAARPPGRAGCRAGRS
jgi:membrane-associated phospholipid phosphatase